MAECTNCGTVLDDTIDHCPGCGKPAKKWKADLVFLAMIGDFMEANKLQALLESENIDSRRLEKEAGSFLRTYTGFSAYGADFYVPAKDLEKAKELVATLELPLEQPQPLQDESKKIDVNGRMVIVMVIVVMVLAAFLLGGLGKVPGIH